MAQKYSQIIKKLGISRVRQNELLAGHTTFKIGGPADVLVETRSESELIELIKLIRELKIPYFIMGAGSKVLVVDEGFRGVIIKIRNSKFEIRNSRIIAEAGVLLETLVNESAEVNLTGLEFAAGIPGTVAGAVRGNAGAWQQSIGDKILRVKILNENNKISWLSKKSCQFSYRQSRLKKSGEIILEVELALKKGKPQEIRQKIATYLSQRKDQPKEPSVGSIFVNPKPQSAGELIEACGLKGKRIGNAQISTQHANFIVNLGKAKAEEVIKLIELIKKKVKKQFGIELEEEVNLLWNK